MTTTAVSIIKRLFLFFLVFTGLYYAKIFLMPLATGAVLAALFLPFCKWMEEKKLPKGLAALTCLFVLLLAFAGVAALVSWQIAELTSDIELLKEKSGVAINRIKEYINQHFGISHKKQEEMLEGQQTSANGILTMIAGSLSLIFSTVLF